MTRDLNRALWIVGLVTIFVTALLIGAFPLRSDMDAWWHLKTGKVLLETGDWFPKHDVFTYTAENIKWSNHEWLIDILMYKGYQAVGLRGLIVLKGVLLGITFMLTAWLCLRYSGNVYAALLFGLIGAVGSRYSVHLRPYIVSYLALAVFLHLLLNVRRDIRPKLSLAIMFFLSILWINLHGGGILSIVVMALATVGTFGEWVWAVWISKEPETRKIEGKNLRLFVVGGFLVALGTLCNPFTYHIHLLTLKVMGEKSLIIHINELQVPDLHSTGGYMALIFLTIVLFGVCRRRLHFVDLLIILFFFHQSINHVRHLPLFCVAAPPILSMLPFWVLPDSLKTRESVKTRLSFAVLVFFALTALQAIGKDVRRNLIPLIDSEGFIPENHPYLAVKAIKKFKPRANMYNQINYAGYLIWELSPEEYKVFTDSRFDIFGSQFMEQSHSIQDAVVYAGPFSPLGREPANDWETKLLEYENVNRELQNRRLPPVPFWRFLLWRWDVEFLLLSTQCNLTAVLHTGDGVWDPSPYEKEGSSPDDMKFPRWREIFFGGGYGIYVRDIPRNKDLTKDRVGEYLTGLSGYAPGP